MMPFIKHPRTGELFRFGQMHRRLEWSPLEGSTPPGWLLSTGTVTVDQFNGNYGYVIVTSAGADGDRAELRVNPPGNSFLSTSQAAFLFTLEGMRAGDTSDFDWEVALENTGKTTGVAVRQNWNGDMAGIRINTGPATVEDINYKFWSVAGEKQSQRNLQLLYVRHEKLVCVLDRGEVIGWADASTMPQGAVLPRVYLTARNGNHAVALHVGKIRLDIWT